MLRRSSSMARLSAPYLVLLAVLSLASPGLSLDEARADQCSNPCNIGDGDTCASMQQVVELGESLAVRLGRQTGTCGGITPFTDSELALTWSREPTGPFTPVPVSRLGDDLLITPDRAGPYFIKAAARDGKGAPDQLVIMVVDPATGPVRLRLRPSKGLAAARTAIKVRWLPAGDVDDRFPRRRWPVWRNNDRAGLAEQPLRLPPGRYDVEWIHRQGGRAQTGVTTVDVTGPGDVDVPLTAPPAPSSR